MIRKLFDEIDSLGPAISWMVYFFLLALIMLVLLHAFTLFVLFLRWILL